MTAARVLHAGLELLDRQMLDRDGTLCGKVDDLELAPLAGEDGPLYVTAIHAGPGALLRRLGAARFGAWVQRAVTGTAAGSIDDPLHGRGDDDRVDPTRIPFGKVQAITDHVSLAVDAEDLATAAGERWSRTHVLGHLPGGDRGAPG